MIHDDTPDPVAARAIAERQELLRIAAKRCVENHRAGRAVDPYTLEWARQVVRNTKPLGGWLGTGDPTPTPAHARAHSTPETPT